MRYFLLSVTGVLPDDIKKTGDFRRKFNDVDRDPPTTRCVDQCKSFDTLSQKAAQLTAAFGILLSVSPK